MINNAEILPSLKITFCKFELSKTAITIAPLNILPAFREQKNDNLVIDRRSISIYEDMWLPGQHGDVTCAGATRAEIDCDVTRRGMTSDEIRLHSEAPASRCY